MSLTFQSLCSGSSANCLLLQNSSTTLLFDAGFRSQKQCREMLGALLPDIDAVVVSHLHGDHIRYPALRVLEQHAVPVYIHESEVPRLATKHYGRWDFPSLDVRTYTDDSLRIGEFDITPFPVPHDGEHQTFGFEVTAAVAGCPRRLVLATDFWDWWEQRDRFLDADFIYLEANHDPDLLRQRPNPNSHYHLSNGNCGLLLKHALQNSRTRPAAVMLGHLSDQRNTPERAAGTVSAVLDGAGHGDVTLLVAPRDVPSDCVSID
jgi:phosphoribosyl 1,2-cyclic phosphodiesterase